MSPIKLTESPKLDWRRRKRS